MVTNTAYKIIKKAVIVRIKKGENYEEILDSYPKLSNEQRAQMIEELIQEGYIIIEDTPVEDTVDNPVEDNPEDNPIEEG